MLGAVFRRIGKGLEFGTELGWESDKIWKGLGQNVEKFRAEFKNYWDLTRTGLGKDVTGLGQDPCSMDRLDFEMFSTGLGQD